MDQRTYTEALADYIDSIDLEINIRYCLGNIRKNTREMNKTKNESRLEKS